MAKKIIPTSSVHIQHSMSNDEKMLFRILLDRALPELDTGREHTIAPQDLLKLWGLNKSEQDLEQSFWNIGVVASYTCNINPERNSWGVFSLFDCRGITEKGMYRYAYNKELKKMIFSLAIYETLIQENLISKPVEPMPFFSAAVIPCTLSCLFTFFLA